MTELFEKFGNNVWSVYYKKTYNYDAFGNSITGKLENWQNNTWVIISNFDIMVTVYVQSAAFFSSNFTAHYEAHFSSITTGVTENKDDSQFAFYPNPANDVITITQNGNKITAIKVFNIQGQEVMMLPVNTSESVLTIAVDKLSKGIYFLQMNTGKELVNKKFVVSR